MLVFLLSLAVLSVHGQNGNDQDEALRKVLSEVEILKGTVEKMQAMIQGISVQGENADHKYEDLRKKFDIQTENMQVKNAALKHDLQELNRSRLVEPVICFSAAKTSTQAATAGDNILFETEIIDTHDTYNPTFGAYGIPQDGIYEVIVTLYKSNSDVYNGASGELYVGDTFLAEIYNNVDSGTTANFHSTVSIIQEFRAGNVLHVKAAHSSSFYGTSSRRSQFSAKYLGPAPSA